MNPPAERPGAGLGMPCRFGGVQVLGLAAVLLPAVGIDRSTVRYQDVGAALFAAVARLRGGGEHQRRVWADESLDMFAAYLVASGAGAARRWPSRMVRAWMLGRDLAQVRAGLAAAAGYWHRQLRQPDLPEPPEPPELAEVCGVLPVGGVTGAAG